jgi:hypothetical protein
MSLAYSRDDQSFFSQELKKYDTSVSNVRSSIGQQPVLLASIVVSITE